MRICFDCPLFQSATLPCDHINQFWIAAHMYVLDDGIHRFCSKSCETKTVYSSSHTSMTLMFYLVRCSNFVGTVLREFSCYYQQVWSFRVLSSNFLSIKAFSSGQANSYDPFPKCNPCLVKMKYSIFFFSQKYDTCLNKTRYLQNNLSVVCKYKPHCAWYTSTCITHFIMVMHVGQ